MQIVLMKGVLGLVWNLRKDSLALPVSAQFGQISKLITKRLVLYTLVQLCDTCCIVLVTFLFKNFFLHFWCLSLDWDTPLPPAFMQILVGTASFSSHFLYSSGVMPFVSCLSDEYVSHSFADPSQQGYTARLCIWCLAKGPIVILVCC